MPPPSIRKPMASRQEDRRRLRPRPAHADGDSAVLKSVDPRQFIDDKFGLPTVKDILSELEKLVATRARAQDRDLRRGHQRDFDLKPGMTLEGTQDQCRRLRRLRRHRRPSGRFGARVSAACRPLRQRSSRSCESRRCGQGSRRRGGMPSASASRFPCARTTAPQHPRHAAKNPFKSSPSRWQRAAFVEPQAGEPGGVRGSTCRGHEAKIRA